ncbi:hypothetical protein APY94_04020 [Thermococcus celericrescens]|uniref:Uncharacterized protein n=1 Tax=Thermococcus celericrescens TaxID=227598 RepID=A0A100XYH3_9EURY|nr:hypothetical protein [Thermococcus celericrescens]KUH33905.1 hypothetical protein APY94_04020 [Thermococcus celericrescens]
MVMRIWNFLMVLVLISGIMASAGCIRQDGGALIIDFNNETYTLPLPGNNTTTSNETNSPTSTPTLYTYTEQVQVGEELVIKELNFTIRPDYDFTKGKFFFITPSGVYWEPMNITVGNVTILGKEYFVGTTVYMVEITIQSPEQLTIVVKEVNEA